MTSPYRRGGQQMRDPHSGTPQGVRANPAVVRVPASVASSQEGLNARERRSCDRLIAIVVFIARRHIIVQEGRASSLALQAARAARPPRLVGASLCAHTAALSLRRSDGGSARNCSCWLLVLHKLTAPPSAQDDEEKRARAPYRSHRGAPPAPGRANSLWVVVVFLLALLRRHRPVVVSSAAALYGRIVLHITPASLAAWRGSPERLSVDRNA